MNVSEYLRLKAIRYRVVKNQSGEQALMDCPRCGDKSSFAINLDTGAYNCKRLNKCGISGSFFQFQILMGDDPLSKRDKIYNLPDVKYESPNQKVYDWFKKRKISENSVRQFKIGLSPDGQAVMFLYYKQSKLMSVKYRAMEEKFFWKEKNTKSVLWNQDNVKGDKLLVCEGETDCTALFEYGYAGVSIPSGVNDMTWIEHDWQFLEKFKEIYLIMDNDNAGQSIVDNLVNRLGKWRCRNVLLPYKDVNDCLMMGLPKEKFDECILNAQEFNLTELKHSDYYTNKIISYKNNKNLLDGALTSNAKLTSILRGWRKSEISVWTGRNGSGKSTMILQEILFLLQQGKKCCIGSFEMPPYKYLWWLVKQSLQKWNISDYDVEETLNRYAENLFVIDILGDIEKQNLLQIMEYGVRKYGIDVFVVDSLMKIKFASENYKILGEQKEFVSAMKNFVSEYKCHVHIVAHPRKGSSDSEIPDSSDISGTGDISNLADNVFVVYRYTDEQKELRRKSGIDYVDNFLEVKKNREHGILGRINFIFNPEHKTFDLCPFEKEKLNGSTVGSTEIKQNNYQNNENLYEEKNDEQEELPF
jgi:twinkle protein